MKRRGLPWAGLLVLLAARATAANWAPIPAEIWALKEDPAHGVQGAVVLEDRLSIRGSYLEYLYRVRILSEAGKDAAELPALPNEAYDIDGRTVFADGHEVRFSDKKDLQTVAVKARGESLVRSKIAPPGVTGDCVVEIRWKESSSDSGGPLPAHYGFFPPVRARESVSDPRRDGRAAPAVPLELRLHGSQDLKPEVKNRLVYTFHDIPRHRRRPLHARAPPGPAPFHRLLAARHAGGPRPRGRGFLLEGRGAARLQGVVRQDLKGGDLDAFTREMLRACPKILRAKAVELMLRLDGKSQT